MTFESVVKISCSSFCLSLVAMFCFDLCSKDLLSDVSCQWEKWEKSKWGLLLCCVRNGVSLQHWADVWAGSWMLGHHCHWTSYPLCWNLPLFVQSVITSAFIFCEELFGHVQLGCYILVVLPHCPIVPWLFFSETQKLCWMATVAWNMRCWMLFFF